MRILTERQSEAKRQQQELLRHDQELSSQAISIRYTTIPAKVRNDFYYQRALHDIFGVQMMLVKAWESSIK